MKQKSFLAGFLILGFVLTGCGRDGTKNSADNSSVEAVSKTPDIPKDCISWFDGCNICTVKDGRLGACTRKYCPPEAVQEPECLKYE